jgi:Reverse transcriptase (RNA-dependent DNA polymerase)
LRLQWNVATRKYGKLPYDPRSLIFTTEKQGENTRKKLQGQKPLGSQLVFKKKTAQYLSVCYKERSVMKGYVQISGVDFTDSYAPVTIDASMRQIFAQLCLTGTQLRNCVECVR